VAATPGSEVNVAEDRPSPADETQRLYNEAEAQVAKAMEDLVSRDSFGFLLVRVTENVMGVTQIANGAIDLVIRNLRLAGRPDLTRLARQIARTEDKLEMVLQEVERLSSQVEALAGDAKVNGAAPRGGNGDSSKPATSSRQRKTSA
jgi:F420-0:gamma-glutamyl ligase-like protein